MRRWAVHHAKCNEERQKNVHEPVASRKRARLETALLRFSFLLIPWRESLVVFILQMYNKALVPSCRCGCAVVAAVMHRFCQTYYIKYPNIHFCVALFSEQCYNKENLFGRIRIVGNLDGGVYSL